MKFKNIVFSDILVKVLFVTLIFVLVFISSMTYKNTLQVSNSSQWVMHSYKVHLEINNLTILMKDAETGQRGFLLTHNTLFLKPYIGAKTKARKSLVQLKRLSEDNPFQQKNVERLSELIEKRFAYLRYSMYQDSLGPDNQMNLRNSLEVGRLLMDSIQEHSDKMVTIEDQYLLKRNQNYVDKITVTPLLILLITLFSLAIFIISYIKINKDVSILEKTNRKLIIANESNQHAEKIGSFCTFHWNIKTGKHTFSDNLHNLLGCEPGSLKESKDDFSHFMHLIHPEDQASIAADQKRIVNGEIDTLSQFFKIMRPDGQLRYFKSIAKAISHKGERTIIGIVSDITDQHNASIAIEKRNFELEQINAELESFNHVASHDLQEPLRKIQLFISRISNADMEALSETGKEYISKIQLATTRMRTLIDDLLSFSRANKADNAFEKTDLNELFQNAKQELAQSILEKNAVITSEKLPVANVIPYQIQQLFINLISNSLKYSRPDVAPVITIQYKKILVSQVAFLKTNPNKEYHQISITDNGMGFDQQFSESIFTLFQRLHAASEFPGTGIGLAICKKIIENHMGAIKAEGRLNHGATFTFFLPE